MVSVRRTVGMADPGNGGPESKGKVCAILLLEFRRGAHLPS